MIAKCSRVSILINTNFYRLFEVVHPIIWEYLEQNHEMVIATADEEGVKFTGDCQFDSPGFSAKYLFYRYGNMKSLKIQISKH
jgi:hypothetical protein